MFQKATRKRVYLKLGMTGPTGSGKTMSALLLAKGLAGEGGKIAVIDTENGSASLYSDVVDFDVVDLAPPFTEDKFISGIKAAVDGGYSVVIIDSGSHFWEGILEFKSKLDARGGNSYTNWSIAGEKYKAVLNAVLQSRIHLIMCLRAKMDYVLETNDKGKQVPRKVGLAPQMRDNTEYEFTVVFDIDHAHQATTSKDRSRLFDGKIFQITEETGKQLAEWRDSAPEAISEPEKSVGGPIAGSPPAAEPPAIDIGRRRVPEHLMVGFNADDEPETWRDVVCHVGQLANGKKLGDVDKTQLTKLYKHWCPTVEKTQKDGSPADGQDLNLYRAITAAAIELGL